MLVRSARKGTRKAAAILAVLYALCVLAPTAGFAFGDIAHVAHCLLGLDDQPVQAAHSHFVSQQHVHSVETAHVHADGTAHSHHTPSAAADSQEQTDQKSPSPIGGKCCGLMAVPALPANLFVTDLPDTPRAEPVLTVQRGTLGQPAVRLDRPPNSLLSY